MHIYVTERESGRQLLSYQAAMVPRVGEMLLHGNKVYRVWAVAYIVDSACDSASVCVEVQNISADIECT